MRRPVRQDAVTLAPAGALDGAANFATAPGSRMTIRSLSCVFSTCRCSDKASHSLVASKPVLAIG